MAETQVEQRNGAWTIRCGCGWMTTCQRARDAYAAEADHVCVAKRTVAQDIRGGAA